MQKMKYICQNVQEPTEYVLHRQRSFSLRVKYNIAKAKEHSANGGGCVCVRLSGVMNIISQTTRISDVNFTSVNRNWWTHVFSTWVPRQHREKGLLPGAARAGCSARAGELAAWSHRRQRGWPGSALSCRAGPLTVMKVSHSPDPTHVHRHQADPRSNQDTKEGSGPVRDMARHGHPCSIAQAKTRGKCLSSNAAPEQRVEAPKRHLIPMSLIHVTAAPCEIWPWAQGTKPLRGWMEAAEPVGTLRAVVWHLYVLYGLFFFFFF